MAEQKKLTAEEVEDQLRQIRLRTAQAELQKAEMELEQTEENVANFKAQREARGRQNAQRQGQLAKDANDLARTTRACSHRQGGSVGKHATQWGKGQSALTIVLLPDESQDSKLIMCSICRLRVFSPNPINRVPRPRNNETAAEAKQRVQQYERDMKAFSELEEMAKDKLTPEAAKPMDCGVTFKFQDGDGREVLIPRPCDSYLQGLDNRQGVER